MRAPLTVTLLCQRQYCIIIFHLQSYILAFMQPIAVVFFPKALLCNEKRRVLVVSV